MSIKFKVLFDETADIFDALSGICKTAKKYKIIAYDVSERNAPCSYSSVF